MAVVLLIAAILLGILMIPFGFPGTLVIFAAALCYYLMVPAGAIGLATVVGTLLAAQRRSLGPGAVAGGVALIGMAFTAMCVASLADAVDVPRHHLLFYVLSDMLVVSMVYLSARAWLSRELISSYTSRHSRAASAR